MCVGMSWFHQNRTVQSKKIGWKIETLMHHGLEAHSKAYQLFESMNQKIVISQDIRFNETRGWNWSSISKPDDQLPCMLMLAWKIQILDTPSHEDGTSNLEHDNHDDDMSNNEDQIDPESSDQEENYEHNPHHNEIPPTDVQTNHRRSSRQSTLPNQI